MPVAVFEIISETEQERGWTYEVRVVDLAGVMSRKVMTMSWADYNRWSRDGSDEPVKIAETVLGVLLRRVQDVNELPEQFDASIVRRRYGAEGEMGIQA